MAVMTSATALRGRMRAWFRCDGGSVARREAARLGRLRWPLCARLHHAGAIKGTLRAAAGMFFVFFSCVSSCVLGEGIFVGRQSPVLMLL